jgi:hypothetical protein
MVFYAVTKNLMLLTKGKLVVLFVQLSYNVNLTTKSCLPPPPGDGGVRIYFLVKKRGGRGRKKSGLNTNTPTPYYRLVPHTNVVTQQKISATKNIAFIHYYCLSHLLYYTATKNNCVLAHIMRKKTLVFQYKIK